MIALEVSTSQWAVIVGVLAAAYLIGAIPFAYIIGRVFCHVDPRRHGSGNLGATNVFRVLGVRSGIATLVLDIAKGSVAVLLAQWLVSSPPYDAAVADWVAVAAALAAVAGHSFSPYVGFKGGKGVAASAGALIVLSPKAFIFVAIAFALVVGITRMVSVGSLTAAILYPILVWYLYPENIALKIAILVLVAVIILRHTSNISRIVHGTEPKLTFGGVKPRRNQEKRG